MDQPRIVAHKPAYKRASRQRGKVAFLQRAYLPRRKLQLLGDAFDGQSGGLSPARKQHPRTVAATVAAAASGGGSSTVIGTFR